MIKTTDIYHDRLAQCAWPSSFGLCKSHTYCRTVVSAPEEDTVAPQVSTYLIARWMFTDRFAKTAGFFTKKKIMIRFNI